MSSVDARCCVPNSLCEHQLPPVEPIAKMAATPGILLSPNCSKPQLPPHLLGQSRPVSSSCKQQQFGSKSTIGNGQSILSPYSERIAQMKCAKKLRLATFRSGCRQIFPFCGFAQHSRSQKLRCCSDPSTILYFNHTQQSLYIFNLGIKYVFQIDISIESFQFINNDQRLLPNHQLNTPLWVIPTAGFFFFPKGPQ